MESKEKLNLNEREYKWALRKFYLFKFFVMFHIFSAVIIPFFTEWVKLNFLQVMFLQSWCMLWVFLSEVPTGAIADKFGRKISIQLGIVAQVIGFSMYIIFPSFGVYLICEMILGISISLMSGADEAFIYDTLKKFDKEEEAKKVLGKSESIGITGIMVAAPIGSVIAKMWGSHMTIILMIIPLTITLFITFLFREPLDKKKNKRKNYINIIKDGVNAFYKEKTLKILATDTIIVSSIGFLLIWLYQVILLEVGVAVEYFGMINTAFILLEILLLNTYTYTEKLLKSKKRLIFISNIIIGLSIIVCGLTTNKLVVIIGICLALGFSMTRKPLMASYMNSYIKSEERATVVSTISMLISFVRMITFPIIGYIVEISLNGALLVVGSILIIFTFISKVKEHHLNPSGSSEV